ncbi:MAG: carbon-phosphorus lyase complex subunit PhnI, partial [Cyanobacteria bacterium J06553_1]
EEEFVLYHSDNIEAQGFVQHLKLPHYIDFQAELNLVRKMRESRETSDKQKQAETQEDSPLAHTPKPTPPKRGTTPGRVIKSDPFRPSTAPQPGKIPSGGVARRDGVGP